MVLEDFNQELVLKNITIPPLANGQVLVELTASGVCGSDVHMFKGDDPRIPLPIILGHEGVGRIVEIHGKKKSVNGQELKPGDLILWHRGVSCGKCFFCKVQKTPALCSERWVYGISNSLEKKPFLNGCYADYIILSSETDIFSINEQIDPAVLVSASCSGSTAAHCFDYVRPMIGDSVLIQGPGPLGIFAAYFAANLGASKIIMIGGTGKRLLVAKDFGVTNILNRETMSLEERKEAVFELTQGRGVDYAIEAVGHPSAVKEGLKLVRRGGSFISVGFGEPNGSITVDCFNDIVQSNIAYQGVWVSDTKHTYSALNSILKNARLFSKLITHRFPLEKVNQALKAMETKEAVKAVLV